MTHVLIMRGIPGSGKTTEAARWAKLLPGSVTVGTDIYMFAGGRPFDHTQLERCHEQCKTDYMAALEAKAPLVIVDNTNTKFSDIVFYVNMAEQHGYEFTILQLHEDPKVAFERGTHQVPMETLELMATRIWTERLPASWPVWSYGKPWRPPKRTPKVSPKPPCDHCGGSGEEPGYSGRVACTECLGAAPST